LTAIGRLSAEKNLLNTIAAVGRVAGCRLVLVGTGPLKDELVNYIAENGLSDRVLLTGHLDHQSAVDVLFASDVFLQLSFSEGRSVALLEALCAERPIVASDIPSQAEVLALASGQSAGILCDPSDVDAMANATVNKTEFTVIDRDSLVNSSLLTHPLYGEFARNSVFRYQELELAVSQLRTLA